MIQRLKHTLSHIDAKSLRYRFVHTVVKAEDIRGSKACVFYWGYIPLTVIAWIMIPFIAVCWVLLVKPIAWLTGYERTNATPGFLDSEYDQNARLFRNRQAKHPPWRYVLPLMGLAIVIFFGADGFFTTEIITASVIVVLLLTIGAIYYWRKPIAAKWNEICPRLEVTE